MEEEVWFMYDWHVQFAEDLGISKYDPHKMNINVKYWNANNVFRVWTEYFSKLCLTTITS